MARPTLPPVDMRATRAQLRSLAFKDDVASAAAEVAYEAALGRARALYASLPPITGKGKQQLQALAERMREPKAP